MKWINWSNLGGLKFTQNRLGWMQDGTMAALGSIAKLCGNKTILCGVELIAGNVTNGWISLDGELVEFVGGVAGARVIVTTTNNSYDYANNVLQPVELNKTATCGAIGGFAFSELVRLSALQNIWLPGDLKQKYVNNAYIAANFDVDGYGLNGEKGWRILSSVVPAAAGKVLVNRDAGDVDFDVCGDTGGTKTVTLQGTETGSLKIKGKFNDADGGAVTEFSNISINGQLIPKDGAGNDTTFGSEITVRLNNDAAAHNNLQPFFTVLTLIKL
jgi:hypothetical protein